VAVYAKDKLGSIAVPVQTTVVKSMTVATFDQNTGMLSIPCLDVQGTTFSLNLSFTSSDPVTFQLMPDFAQVDECSPCASFDMQAGVLHINILDLGISYWVDLQLSGTDPIAFSLINIGEN